MKHDKVEKKEKKQKKSKTTFILFVSSYSGDDSVTTYHSFEECKKNVIELVEDNRVDLADIKIYKVSKTWCPKQSSINFVEEK
jgi:hypothetical protein